MLRAACFFILFHLTVLTVQGQKKDPCKEAAKLVAKGDTLFGSAAYEEALISYNEALKLCPSRHDISLMKGDLYLQMEKYENARKEFFDYRSKHPDDPKVYRKIAGWHYYTGNMDSSLFYLGQTTSMNPSDTIAWYTSGELYYQEGMPDEALDCFFKAYNLDTSDTDVLIYIVKIYYFTERITQGRAWLAKTKQMAGETNDVILAEAYYLEAEGKTGEAIARLETAQIKTKEDVYLLMEKIKLLMRLEKYSEAYISLEEAQKYDPEQPDIYYYKGKINLLTGKYEFAIVDFDQCLLLDPGFHEAHFDKGNVFFNIQQYEKAIESYSHYLLSSKQDDNVLFNRGTCYYSIGEYRKAITDFEMAIGINEVPDYFYNKALCHYALAEYDPATSLMQTYIAYAPADPDAYYYLCLAGYEGGNKAEACGYCHKAIEMGKKEFPDTVIRGCKLKKKLK